MNAFKGDQENIAVCFEGLCIKQYGFYHLKFVGFEMESLVEMR